MSIQLTLTNEEAKRVVSIINETMYMQTTDAMPVLQSVRKKINRAYQRKNTIAAEKDWKKRVQKLR